jgi:starch-binding outer membrane protein, SusD/RagB family
MRYLKYIFILIAATSFLFSCKKDLLETIPNDRISTEIFWKTDNDALMAANAVYTFLAEGGEHFIAWDGMSDIVYANPTGPAEALVSRGDYNALNARITNDWNDAYAGIRAANTFFANVDRIETNNTALINRLKGEVRALRAYFYIRLASLYGDVPLVTTEITLAESQQISRTPIGQIWDFISTELTKAADELPLNQAEKGRVRKGAALA